MTKINEPQGVHKAIAETGRKLYQFSAPPPAPKLTLPEDSGEHDCL